MTRRYKVVDGSPFCFVTNSTAWWTPVFISNLTCDVLIESLSFCRERKGLRVFSCVIMPTHFHAVVSTETEGALTGVMRDFKQFTSRKIARVLGESGWELPLRAFRKAAQRAGRGNDHKVWQDEFHPVALTTEVGFRQKVEYIHLNPVRKGLVAEPCHWVYSSARWYERGESGPLELDELEW